MQFSAYRKAVCVTCVEWPARLVLTICDVACVSSLVYLEKVFKFEM